VDALYELAGCTLEDALEAWNALCEEQGRPDWRYTDEPYRGLADDRSRVATFIEALLDQVRRRGAAPLAIPLSPAEVGYRFTAMDWWRMLLFMRDTPPGCCKTVTQGTIERIQRKRGRPRPLCCL
jgi:hypothetical protein